MTQYTLTEAPQRQFLLTEFEQRLARAQTMMRALKLDAGAKEKYVKAIPPAVKSTTGNFPVLATSFTNS